MRGRPSREQHQAEINDSVNVALESAEYDVMKILNGERLSDDVSGYVNAASVLLQKAILARREEVREELAADAIAERAARGDD